LRKIALTSYPVLELPALRFGLTIFLLLPTSRSLRRVKGTTLAAMLGVGGLLLAYF
jgi:hypothetical protein